MAITQQGEKYTIKCQNCNNMAELTTLYLMAPNEPKKIIISSTCPSCGERSSSIETIFSQHEKGGISINCNFKSRDDINRYISLTKRSIFKIYENNELIYEYINDNDLFILTEDLLRKLIGELVENYQLGYKLELMGVYNSLEKDIEVINELKNKLKDDIQYEIKIKVLEVIENLRRMIENPLFKVEIIDNSGYSRVLPYGKKLSDMDIDDIESFNDEYVIHKWYKVD